MRAKLLDTINRVYEVQLAKLELESLGAGNVQFDLGKLEFNFEIAKNLKEKLVRRITWFESIDDEETWTNEIMRLNRRVLRKYADLWFSHFVYPFKARFRPPLARSLINTINPEDEGIILDNFCGSGTTQVEAYLLGLNSIGSDINPFYTTMTEAKVKFFTHSFKEGEAERFWQKYWRDDLFYHMPTELPKDVHPLLPIIYSYATQIMKKPRKAYFKRYGEMMLLQDEWFKVKNKYKLGKVKNVICSAEKLPYPDKYFTGIVTSPPYSSALDYTKENRGDPEFFPITPELKKLYEPTKDRVLFYVLMEKVIKESVRVIKPGKKIAFVIGNQRKKDKIIDIVGWCIEEFEKDGCQLLYDIPQLISSTGTHNILTDHILILQKKK